MIEHVFILSLMLLLLGGTLGYLIGHDNGMKDANKAWSDTLKPQDDTSESEPVLSSQPGLAMRGDDSK